MMLRPSTVLVLLALPAAAIAADGIPEIATDRPDFTESPTAVPHRMLQFEGGFTWEREEGLEAFGAPEGLLRWGVARRFELRFGLPQYLDTHDAAGFGDASIGAKYEIGRFRGADVGAIATFTLPTGEDELSSGEVEPGAILTAGRDLGERWSLGGQVGVASVVTNERRFLWSATLVAGRSLTPVWNTFLELAGEIDDAGNGQLVLHHGHAFPVTPDLQFDVHGGAGLTFDAPDLFLGAGLAVRR